MNKISFLELEECNREISVNVSEESCASVFRAQNMDRKEPLADVDIDGSCEHSNEQSVSINDRELLEYLSD